MACKYCDEGDPTTTHPIFGTPGWHSVAYEEGDYIECPKPPDGPHSLERDQTVVDFDPREAFLEGVLDWVEGEIPRELWNNKVHAKGLEEWRVRCMRGLLANWDEFHSSMVLPKESPQMDTARMRIYCLGVAKGMER